MSRLAVIIPAYNEAKVIENTIKAAKRQLPEKHIYLVNDNSSDQTAQLAASQLSQSQILNLSHNHGKAAALNKAIKHFRLLGRYQYIFPLDADTQLSPDFVKQVVSYLDQHPQTDMVIGQVLARPINTFTLYRQFEYYWGQAVIKQAQSIMGLITVAPGCSSVYRASLLKQHSIPTQTVTEDMDLTFTLQRSGKYQIDYLPQAKVYTQDPQTLGDYTGQILRWYTGFWQCLVKHKIPWGGQWFDLEVGWFATEGLIGSLILPLWLAFIPILWLLKPEILLLPLAVDLLIFWLPMLLWVSVYYKQPQFVLRLPHFYLIKVYSSLIFLRAFFRVVVGIDFDRHHIWNTRRYQMIN